MATKYANAWYAPRMSHITRVAQKAWENSADELIGYARPATFAEQAEREQVAAERAAEPEAPVRGHQIPDALAFITGGKACFTLRSTKTGVRYTYKVTENEKGGWFVSLLDGPDNYLNYRYLGFIGQSDRRFRTTAKSTFPAASKPVRAFEWTWVRLAAGRSHEGVEIYHEGKCGRCGRKLTVPESIESGFGPECAGKLM